MAAIDCVKAYALTIKPKTVTITEWADESNPDGLVIHVEPLTMKARSALAKAVQGMDDAHETVRTLVTLALNKSGQRLFDLAAEKEMLRLPGDEIIATAAKRVLLAARGIGDDDDTDTDDGDGDAPGE